MLNKSVWLAFGMMACSTPIPPPHGAVSLPEHLQALAQIPKAEWQVQLVDASNGTVYAESTYPAGTTATYKLVSDTLPSSGTATNLNASLRIPEGALAEVVALYAPGQTSSLTATLTEYARTAPRAIALHSQALIDFEPVAKKIEWTQYRREDNSKSLDALYFSKSDAPFRFTESTTLAGGQSQEVEAIYDEGTLIQFTSDSVRNLKSTPEVQDRSKMHLRMYFDHDTFVEGRFMIGARKLDPDEHQVRAAILRSRQALETGKRVASPELALLHCKGDAGAIAIHDNRAIWTPNGADALPHVSNILGEEGQWTSPLWSEGTWREEACQVDDRSGTWTFTGTLPGEVAFEGCCVPQASD